MKTLLPFAFGRWVIGAVVLLGLISSPAKAEDVRVLSQTGHRSTVTAVALMPEQGLVMSGGADRAVVVWDAQTGAVLQRINPRARVLHLLPAPGSTRLWVWTWERAEIHEPQCFDALTGAVVNGLRPPAVNPKAGAETDQYHIWVRRMQNSPVPAERALWQKLAPAVGEEPTSYFVSTDQRHVVLGFDGGRAELWDTGTARRVQSFETKAEFVHGVSCSGDGGRLATWKFRAGRAQTGRSRGADLRIWDLTALQVRRCDLRDFSSINSACITKDGQFVYALAARTDDDPANDFRLLEINARSGTVVRQIGPKFPRAGSLRLSADDSLLAVHEYCPGDGARIMIWNRKPKSEALRELPWKAERTYQSRGAFFPDNRSLLAGVWERPAHYDLASGKRTYEIAVEGLRLPNGSVQPLASRQADASTYPLEITGMLMDVDVRTDGRWVGYGATHRGIGGHEVLDLQTRRRWIGDIPGFHHLRFRSNYPHVIVAGSHGSKTVQVRQLETGAVIDTWSEQQAETDRTATTDAVGWTALMDSLTMTADGNRLFVAKTDGAIRMLELNAAGRFQRQLELVPVGAADWCAILPNGYYSGSPAGVASIRLVRGGVTLPLTQLDVSFNRPDEVLEVLGASVAVVKDLRRLVELRASKGGAAAADPFATRRPRVRLPNGSRMPLQTDRETFPMEIEASSSGVPVARLQVLVDGVPWPDSRGIALDQAAGARAAVKKITVPLGHGVNRIQVSAADTSGVESLAETVQVERIGARRRNVHALLVGVSAYANTDFNLHFAASDARAVEKLAATWADAGGELKATVLTDADATREKILAAAGQVFRSTGPDDLAVVFLSGHGVLDGPSREQWFFCPHDHDFIHHTRRGVSYAEVAACFDGAGARQRLLLIDSCHSGEIEEAEKEDAQKTLGARGVTARAAGPRTANPSAGVLGAKQHVFRIQDVFADFRGGVGAAVIGASGGLQFALESSELRQGVFTHSLIGGVSASAADLDKDGRILTSELHRYLADQVFGLTEGAQQPSSRGINPEGDFALLTRAVPRPVASIPRTTENSPPLAGTPRTAAAPVGAESLDSFVRRFIASGDSGSAEIQLNFYDRQITRYFDVKNPTPDKVRIDLLDYQTRWPFRRYTLAGSPEIQPAGKGLWKVKVSLQFAAARTADGANPRTGQVRNSLLIAQQGDRFLVRGIWSD